MLKTTLLKAATLLFLSMFTFSSCNNGGGGSSNSTPDGTITFDVNGEHVISSGPTELNSTYSQSQGVVWIYAIEGMGLDQATGLTYYDHRLDINISNVSSLTDLVGTSIPYDDFPDETTPSFLMSYSVVPSNGDVDFYDCTSASLTITSVNNDKISGYFEAEFEDFLTEEPSHSITNGSINQVAVIVF